MQKRGPFTLLTSREVYKNPWIRVRESKVMRPEGKKGVFGVVSVIPGVTVVAIDKEGYCYLIREYGYGMGGSSLKLVSGGIDHGETPLKAAKREVREEVGLAGGTWRYLGSIHYYPTILHTVEHLYLVVGTEQIFSQSVEDSRYIRIVRMLFAKAVRMALTGKINGAESMAAILRANHYLYSRNKDEKNR